MKRWLSQLVKKLLEVYTPYGELGNGKNKLVEYIKLHGTHAPNEHCAPPTYHPPFATIAKAFAMHWRRNCSCD